MSAPRHSDPRQAAAAPGQGQKDAPRVAIVGAGAAGLYAALLLQSYGYLVTVYEATGRVGGRIFTHHFTAEPEQYFEAGAMRIPPVKAQKILHTLIDALNEHTQTEADESTEPERVLERWHIKKIEYFLNVPGNQLLVNGYLVNGDDSGKTTPESIGWDVPEKFKRQSAGQLLECSLETFKIMKWEDIVERFDQFSFRHFLSLFGKNKADEIAGWPDEVIDFVETVTSQTNQFALSVPEMWMQYQDFSSSDSEAAKEPWHTIQGGMDRLPHTMAHFVGLENITFGARVRSLRVDDLDEKDKFAPQKVRVIAEGYNGTISQLYDQVLLAIPPAALKMIPDRPFWSSRKDMAIRSMHFEPLYKMGLRFKTRFWEKSEPSSKGGQSTTDLPIRWIVYPSNGIDDDGPGVLLVYAWMTDATAWLPLTPVERRSLAIWCLNQLYGSESFNVRDELIETFDVAWVSENATGDAMFLPGQWRARYEDARRPEGSIFFAGEHLSTYHTWIAGALHSAAYAVHQMTGQPLKEIGIRKAGGGKKGALDVMPLTPKGERQRRQEAHPEPPSYTPRDPLFPHDVGEPSKEKKKVERLPRPQSLGAQTGPHFIGPRVSSLMGFSAAV